MRESNHFSSRDYIANYSFQFKDNNQNPQIQTKTNLNYNCQKYTINSFSNQLTNSSLLNTLIFSQKSKTK